MTALPLPNPDPDDPAEILRVLPDRYAQYFCAEYAEALELARDPAQFPALRALLHHWRLRALMYSQPGYEQRSATAREAARTGDWGDVVPLDDVIAGLRRP